jgi:hypothetical protein
LGDVERLQRWQRSLWSLLSSVGLHDAATTVSYAASGILQPEPGAVISGLVDVEALTDHADFERWQLDILLFGEEAYAKSVAVSSAARWGRLTTMDTTLYPNGEHTLRLRVVRDDQNYDEFHTPIVIDNRATPPRQGNGITEPAAGSTVSGQVRVRGVAYHPAFWRWEMWLLPGGDEQRAKRVALSGSARTYENTLTRFDTTEHADGEYVLRLRVVRDDRNYHEYDMPIVINNQDGAAASGRTPSATERQGNGVWAPGNGQPVRGIVRINGRADDPDFMKWQLDLLLEGDDQNATYIDGNDRPIDQVRRLLNLDTRKYPNGAHLLRLRVVRSDYNYDEYTAPLVIRN